MIIKVELAENSIEVDSAVIHNLPDDPIRYQLDRKEHLTRDGLPPRVKIIKRMGKGDKGCCFHYAIGGDDSVVGRNEMVLCSSPDYTMVPGAIVYYLKEAIRADG